MFNKMSTYAFSVIVVSCMFATVRCQIPSFGGCPVYQPMAEFDKERFMGTWYEAERYFVITELAARCISVTYERRPDDLIWVNNSITNRFNGVQRIIAGKMKLLSKSGEGKYSVQYNVFPYNYETTLNVLDTDYTTFAVIWSCNGIGPVGHAESAWVMTRDRIPAGPVMQRAYGVLDKYQINRRFFIKTDQTNCEAIPPAQEAYDPTEPSTGQANNTTNEKKKKSSTTNKIQEKSDDVKEESLTNATVVSRSEPVVVEQIKTP